VFEPETYPDLYGNIDHVVRINYYPPRGDNKEGWDNIDIFGWLGYPMQIKIDFLCRDSILAAPIVLDLALFLDLAHRQGASGVQEWLSFFLKAPQSAGLTPAAHDLFVQRGRLDETLRGWATAEEPVSVGRRKSAECSLTNCYHPACSHPHHHHPDGRGSGDRYTHTNRSRDTHPNHTRSGGAPTICICCI
jgi:hypothetical protein